MKVPIRLTAVLRAVLVLGLAALWFADTAHAQGPHQHGAQPTQISLSSQDVLPGIAHGATLGAAVFLAGLVAFVTLVWLPEGRVGDADQEKAIKPFCRWMWVLVALLVVAGLVELPFYAVRASGEGLSLGLLREALFDTRVGQLWSERLVFGILTAAVASYAAQPRRSSYWWMAALVASALLLLTLTQQSHAAAEESILPVVADWLHVMAASLWMGGLLGFPILLIGPLRAMPIETRAKLLGRAVPRFSKVATMAVMSLILTGLVAVLLHVPNFSALIDTPYGRALSIKLGLLAFLLALGAQNFRLRGRGPFGRFVGAELILAIGIFVATGFLTSLPPADAAQQAVEETTPNSLEGIRQPPIPLPTPPGPRNTAAQPPRETARDVVRVSGTQGTEYSGVYGGAAAGTTTVDGTLGAEPKEYQLEIGDGASDDISAAFKKTRLGAGTLKVEIVANGEVVAERETSEELGTVAASWSPQTGRTWEGP